MNGRTAGGHALGREVYTCHPPKIEPMVRERPDQRNGHMNGRTAGGHSRRCFRPGSCQWLLAQLPNSGMEPVMKSPSGWRKPADPCMSAIWRSSSFRVPPGIRTRPSLRTDTGSRVKASPFPRSCVRVRKDPDTACYPGKSASIRAVSMQLFFQPHPPPADGKNRIRQPAVDGYCASSH